MEKPVGCSTGPFQQGLQVAGAPQEQQQALVWRRGGAPKSACLPCRARCK
jgi:hypothetical protein